MDRSALRPNPTLMKEHGTFNWQPGRYPKHSLTILLSVRGAYSDPHSGIRKPERNKQYQLNPSLVLFYLSAQTNLHPWPGYDMRNSCMTCSHGLRRRLRVRAGNFPFVTLFRWVSGGRTLAGSKGAVGTLVAFWVKLCHECEFRDILDAPPPPSRHFNTCFKSATDTG